MKILPNPVFLAAILAFATFVQTGPASAMTGKELYDTCRAYPNDGQTASCEFFVSSLADVFRQDDTLGNPRGKICIGTDVPVAELVGTATKWLADHPEMQGMRAYDALYDPIARKYPCK
ncbi:MAG: Rap1a/Tai family immunity protein [Hyphomicrobiales bacterium]